MFGDAREWHGFVAIIEHRRTQKIASIAEHLEIERSISQPPKLEVKETVNWTTVDHMCELFIDILKPNAETNFDIFRSRIAATISV